MPALPALKLVRTDTRVPDIVANLPAVMAAVQQEVDAARQLARYRAALAGLVFAYWAHRFHHKKARLDPKRDRLIQHRLIECEDNVSDLLWMLDAAAKDDWVNGTAPNAKHPNDSIDYLFRDRGMVEKFGERSKGFRDSIPHPLAVKHLGET